MRSPSLARSVRSLLSSLILCGVIACAIGGVVSTSGCSRTIGDGCASNVECSALGDRFCDLSSPGGYCTIEGCDIDTCPDSAACVRFFSLKKGQTRCFVGRTARADCADGSAGCCKPGSADCCSLGELCLCDGEGCAEQQMSGAQGFCASESSERRWCMRGCDDDGDCRDGYACVPTGSGGSISVAARMSDGTINQPMLRYCAPRK